RAGVARDHWQAVCLPATERHMESDAPGYESLIEIIVAFAEAHPHEDPFIIAAMFVSQATPEQVTRCAVAFVQNEVQHWRRMQARIVEIDPPRHAAEERRKQERLADDARRNHEREERDAARRRALDRY